MSCFDHIHSDLPRWLNLPGGGLQDPARECVPCLRTTDGRYVCWVAVRRVGRCTYPMKGGLAILSNLVADIRFLIADSIIAHGVYDFMPTRNCLSLEEPMLETDAVKTLLVELEHAVLNSISLAMSPQDAQVLLDYIRGLWREQRETNAQLAEWQEEAPIRSKIMPLDVGNPADMERVMAFLRAKLR